MRRIIGIVCAAVATYAAAAVGPAVAGAATTVYAGPPPHVAGLSKAFVARYQPDVNDFFAHRVTVHVGSTVTFKLDGFHTVDLPGKTGEDLPLLTPGALATGVNDSTGTPFWFNGKVPNLGVNPKLFAPAGPKAYIGATRVDNGLALNQKAKPLQVRFTKAGTYKYFCDVHPGMIGFVVVKPKSASIPTAKQAAKALARQEATDAIRLKALSKKAPPADVVDLGQAGKGGTELFDMFPATLQVSAGTVVTFTMTPDSREVHTATFGPQATLTRLANGVAGPSFPADAVYPSDPVAPLTLCPTSHGDGFANTGALDTDPQTKPILPSSKIDFTTPGTYHFICLIHPFMHGTIIVK